MDKKNCKMYLFFLISLLIMEKFGKVIVKTGCVKYMLTMSVYKYIENKLSVILVMIYCMKLRGHDEQ